MPTRLESKILIRPARSSLVSHELSWDIRRGSLVVQGLCNQTIAI